MSRIGNSIETKKSISGHHGLEGNGEQLLMGTGLLLEVMRIFSVKVLFFNVLRSKLLP